MTELLKAMHNRMSTRSFEITRGTSGQWHSVASINPYPEPDDRLRVVLSGTGAGEPCGILNTAGIVGVFVETEAKVLPEIMRFRQPGSSVIAHPSIRVLNSAIPVFQTDKCVGADESPRVIVGDLRTCQWGEDDDSFLFSAYGADLVVLGGWS